MTVSSSTNKVSYSGNGTLTTFAYSFKIFDQDDLTVILRAADGTETTQTITTHYTVTGVGSASGGNVVFGSAPASGVTVVIIREQPLTQGLDLVPNDPFPAQSLEESLDKLTFMAQKHEEELSRAIKASRTNTLTGSEFTISASDRANKIFAFDSSGDLSVTQELGTFKGDWAASTAYVERDLVKDTTTNNVFIVNAAHTSSGSLPLTTNTNSSKYDKIIDVSNPAGDLTVGGNLSVSGTITLGSGAVISEAELEAIDDVTAGTVAASKAVIVDSNKDIASFRNLTATGAITGGSFVIGSADINENDLEAIDGVTAGTVAASKAVVVDVNKDISSFRNLTASGTVTYGSLSDGSITVTAFVDEDNMASDSATLIPTQQSVKAYVDAQVATADALSEVLGNGNTTGGTDISVSTGDDITFADSSKAIFGAGSDLQIYHDGSNSVIKDNGTGKLILDTDGASIEFQKSGLETLATFATDGAVTLYHDNASKLATSSSGISVTGTATATGVSTDAITNSSGNLSISSTQSISMVFDSNNDQTNREFNLQHDSGASLIKVEESGDISFYEDTGTTAKLFWDASAESLGIGTSSVNGALHVQANPIAEFSLWGGGGSFGRSKFNIQSVDDGTSVGKFQITTESTVPSSPELVTITNAGNVGIGASSPTSFGSGRTVVDVTGSTGGYILADDGTTQSRMGSEGGVGYLGTRTNHPVVITTNNAETMRIDSSGNLLVGTTDSTLHTNTTGGGFKAGGDNRVDMARQADTVAVMNRTGNSDGTILQFRKDGTAVGSISVTSSATAYNTSSDRRLKENIADADDASSLIDAIQVRKFDWKTDGTHQRYGLVAQELNDVFPEAVSIPDNEEEMQSVDYSKLVPMLVKEIQSLRNRITELEAN